MVFPPFSQWGVSSLCEITSPISPPRTAIYMVTTQDGPSTLQWNYSLRLAMYQPAFIHSFISEIITGASPVVQWERSHLPMQEIRVLPLVGEDPTCLRATKSVCYNYRAHGRSYWSPTCLRAHTLQQGKPPQWETCASHPEKCQK